MPSYCVIAHDEDSQRTYLDLVLADDPDRAEQIIGHLRPDATPVASLDPQHLRRLAEQAEQLSEQDFAAWLHSFAAGTSLPPGEPTEPLRIERWIAGSANFPDIEAGASIDDLLRAVAGDLNNSAITEELGLIVIEASDANYYHLAVEAVLNRADAEYVERELLGRE